MKRDYKAIREAGVAARKAGRALDRLHRGLPVTSREAAEAYRCFVLSAERHMKLYAFNPGQEGWRKKRAMEYRRGAIVMFNHGIHNS